MSVMVHRLSMMLALIGFCLGSGASLAAGVSVLTAVLRGTLAFVAVGVMSRALFGSACRGVARDLAEKESEAQQEPEKKE